MKYIIIALGCFSLITALISVILVIKFLKLKSIIKHLSVAYSQIETMTLNNKTNTNDNDTHKENFIKFLSDSREWAYQYIENVQQGLNKFVSEVDPLISHFDKYGDVLSKERPDYVAMKTISVSYKELKRLLPTELNK